MTLVHAKDIKVQLRVLKDRFNRITFHKTTAGGIVGREEKVASAREPDNGLLLVVLVWLNLETRKKRESR